jgi:hypothetical protein
VPETTVRYHKGTKRAEAVKFWGIKPPRRPRNVIAFQKEVVS